MTAKHMWHLFRRQSGTEAENYSSWAFGSDPDALARLVLEGKKTATASVYELYAYDNEEIPKVGDYSVILDSNDQAVCVIEDTDVKIVPFSEVDEDHARSEGEGDMSISYWRSVHERIFREWLGEANRTFSQDTMVVLERFKVVFRP